MENEILTIFTITITVGAIIIFNALLYTVFEMSKSNYIDNE